jgi:hypothetical protein
MDQNDKLGKRKQMATKIPENKYRWWTRVGDFRAFRRFNRWYGQLLEEYREQNRLEKVQIVLLVIIIILLMLIFTILLASCNQTGQTEPQATETLIFLTATGTLTQAPNQSPTHTPTPKPTHTPEPIPDHK